MKIKNVNTPQDENKTSSENKVDTKQIINRPRP